MSTLSGSNSIDFDGIISTVKLHRRKQFKLWVLGNHKHFVNSALGKASRRFFDAKPFEEFEEVNSDSTFVGIKWAPWSRYRISSHERSLIPLEATIVNDTHFSCDKVNIVTAFERLAGYSSRIDPRSWIGRGIIKSRTNAVHDAVEIDFPINDVNEKKIYEKLIDNSVGDGFIYDIRLPVVWDRAPFAYVKIRSNDTRFSNVNAYAKLVSPFEVMTEEELRLSLKFCWEIGLQFGEIDILRDKIDGRIYIVDANNTAYGPPNRLAKQEGEIAIRLLAQEFVNQFFK